MKERFPQDVGINTPYYSTDSQISIDGRKTVSIQFSENYVYLQMLPNSLKTENYASDEFSSFVLAVWSIQVRT